MIKAEERQDKRLHNRFKERFLRNLARGQSQLQHLTIQRHPYHPLKQYRGLGGQLVSQALDRKTSQRKEKLLHEPEHGIRLSLNQL